MPQKFPVKQDLIASQLTRGLRLDEEIKVEGKAPCDYVIELSFFVDLFSINSCGNAFESGIHKPLGVHEHI